MDSTSSNEDEEPKVCTVFSSNTSTNEPKTVFDTIAFSVPKKDSPTKEPGGPTEASSQSLMPTPTAAAKSHPLTPTTGMSKTVSMISVLADDLQSDANQNQGQSATPSAESNVKIETGAGGDETKSEQQTPKPEAEETPTISAEPEDEAELPTAKSLFSDAPEVAFPVNTVPSLDVLIPQAQVPTQHIQQATHLPPQIYNPMNVNLTTSSYDSHDPTFDAWIPSQEAKAILTTINSQASGTYIPDKSNMTTPGIIHEEEFMDKVAVNMARNFGDSEAQKRKILSADNVTQDENGLRELIKLGCYRSALNLTKRLLTLCGQGPGKCGQYSKHTPHSLQVWFTRISLLVRIREFGIADSELAAFKDFENPDMYYEYYPDSMLSSGKQRKGSLVPFHFRLLAAEIPQYLRKFNDTMEKLTKLLMTVCTVLKNLESGLNEDGSAREIESGEKALKIWKEGRVHLLYSLANSSIFSKQYHNAFLFLTRLCEIDTAHKPQLKSAIGRLFLQHGDLTSAAEYFHEASELRSLESDSDQVDTFIDSALIMITQNSYSEALALLQQASTLQPDNFTVLNNMAVCLLYLGKVKESAQLMEATVKQNIPQSLQENVLLNLSSIYELENTDGTKKYALLKLISEYRGDGINLASLKLPNII